ncbi:MAG: alpha/beta fold hydrolase [Bacteroidetes bacterium]|nr:alpha/beta fold hydrolase [Bacteroidota bacterium]HET6245212.1 alpha/beta fold hydrolase [Bacteroidia bacterium]
MQEYKSPLYLLNGHAATMYPALFRNLPVVELIGERIDTPDDDFLQLDWVKNGSKKLVIVSHGLEGNSRRHYMLGMAKTFSENNFDVLLWNYRSCGPVMNRTLRFYHSGATDDLTTVINHAINKGYSEISLIGFSLGGNLTLKYLGEKAQNIPTQIKKSVVFSVPCDLSASAAHLNKWYNKIYCNRFLNSLKFKVTFKSQKFEILQERLHLLKTIKTLREFDDNFTAPLHGFDDAADYYEQCSSINYIDKITVPCLIINALNDPFLPTDCYPIKAVENNAMVFLEMPNDGGHCGFTSSGEAYWSEIRAVDFCVGL